MWLAQGLELALELARATVLLALELVQVLLDKARGLVQHMGNCHIHKMLQVAQAVPLDLVHQTFQEPPVSLASHVHQMPLPLLVAALSAQDPSVLASSLDHHWSQLHLRTL